MFDHIGLAVKDFDTAVRFYQAALEPLGFRVDSHDAEGGSAGLGKPGAPQLWLNRSKSPTKGAHLAFVAPTREAVAHFHAAALKAGGKDNGAPGPRPSYGETYYAAFVLDLEGNNLEAVCLKP